jgi:KaiC/GvpD/RAD55 family RecA-like ATPase
MDIFRNFSGSVVASVSGKDSILYIEKMLADSIKEGEKTLLVVPDYFSEDLMKRIEKRHEIGEFYRKKNYLSIIDMYSSASGLDIESGGMTTHILGTYLTRKTASEVLGAIKSFAPEKIIITSIKAFAINNDQRTFRYFMNMLVTAARDKGSKIIFLNDHNDQETLNHIDSFTDLNIFFRSVSDNKFMEVSSDRGVVRLKYDIFDSRMEMVT